MFESDDGERSETASASFKVEMPVQCLAADGADGRGAEVFDGRSELGATFRPSEAFVAALN